MFDRFSPFLRLFYEVIDSVLVTLIFDQTPDDENWEAIDRQLDELGQLVDELLEQEGIE